MADNQGFQNMDEDTQRSTARDGGIASSDKQDMSKLGDKGAAAQPDAAKVERGKNSHSGGRRSEV